MHFLLLHFYIYNFILVSKIAGSIENDVWTVNVENQYFADEAGLSEAEELIEHFRLPDNLIPLHYTLEIQTNFEPEFTFNGSVDIEFLCNKSTRSIILHAKDLIIQPHFIRVYEKNKLSSGLQVIYYGNTERHNYIIIYMNRELEQDSVYRIAIPYMGNITSDSTGFFRNSYEDYENITRWIAYTQFHAAEPRKVFPCFDEPVLKATFDIIIVRPVNMISISNMPIKQQILRGDNWIADYYEQTPQISTHLVALVVGDLQYKELHINGITIKAWAPAHKLDQVDHSLSLAAKFVSFYERYFAISLSITKLDIVPVFETLKQGMSGWCLITIQENFYFTLLEDEIASTLNLARQIAHQWFGNIVSPLWWNDIWLNEGIANYLAYRAVRVIKQDWQMEEHMIVKVIQSAMTDVSRFSQPLVVDIEDLTEPSYFLSNNFLSKATSMVRTLVAILGEKNFRQGIRTFLINWKFRSASQEILWNFFTELSANVGRNIDVKMFIENWIKQTGFPVVTLSRNFSEKVTLVTQQRYLYPIDKVNYINVGNNLNTQWEVPVTFVDENNLKCWIWLHKENVTKNQILTPEDKWVVLNIKVSGFYLSNYEPENWLLIKKQFDGNHEVFHPDNRLQIIFDAFQLARSGHIDYSIALDLTAYLPNEEDYYVWLIITDHLKFLSDRFQNMCIHRIIARYYVKKTYHIYKALGWKDNAVENILTRKQRNIVLSDMCSFGLKECVLECKTYFREWLGSFRLKTFSSEQKFIILCNGARYGNENDWKFILDRYMEKTSTLSDRIVYLNSLTCSRDLKLLERLLNYTLTDVIEKEHRKHLFLMISSTQRGAKLSWDFFKKFFRIIKEKFMKSNNLLTDLLTNIVKNFRSTDDVKQLEGFTSVYQSEFDWESREFNKLLEDAYQSITWFEKYKNVISDWFIKNTDGAESICNKNER